jgi:hypothetical protein
MEYCALTILNHYTLSGSPPAFAEAISRLCTRVRDEGHPGVLSYRFFVNAQDSTARAVIDYENAAAWIGHHDIAMPWPEMQAMQAVATLDEVVFLGELTPEIAAWIAGSALKARIRQGNSFAAGFRRSPANH